MRETSADISVKYNEGPDGNSFYFGVVFVVVVGQYSKVVSSLYFSSVDCSELVIYILHKTLTMQHIISHIEPFLPSTYISVCV